MTRKEDPDMMAPMASILIASALAIVLLFAVRRYFRYRTPRSVRCPEAGCEATIALDALFAAADVSGEAALEVNACSLWPERAKCGQTCAAQFASQKVAAAVRNANSPA
jgi:hypothetical protein